MRDQSEGKWISPTDAVKLLAPKVGGDLAAKSLIASRLFDQALCAIAKFIREEERACSNKAVFAANPGSMPGYAEFKSKSRTMQWKPAGSKVHGWSVELAKLPSKKVTDEFWNSSLSWKNDLKLWNWQAGSFGISVSEVRRPKLAELALESRKVVYRVLYGVQLDHAQVQTILREWGGDTVHQSTSVARFQGVGGVPPDIERWTTFWRCVVDLARAGRITKGGFSSQAELRRELIAAMGPHPFSDETIKPRVKQIWDAYFR